MGISAFQHYIAPCGCACEPTFIDCSPGFRDTLGTMGTSPGKIGITASPGVVYVHNKAWLHCAYSRSP